MDMLLLMVLSLVMRLALLPSQLEIPQLFLLLYFCKVDIELVNDPVPVRRLIHQSIEPLSLLFFGLGETVDCLENAFRLLECYTLHLISLCNLLFDALWALWFLNIQNA